MIRFLIIQFLSKVIPRDDARIGDGGKNGHNCVYSYYHLCSDTQNDSFQKDRNY